MMTTPTAASRLATQDEQLPVVAIGSAGDVTRVDDPARRIMKTDSGSRDVSLGALVALLLQREPRSRGIVSLSLGHDAQVPPFAALSIVLSVQGGGLGPPPNDGESTGPSLGQSGATHAADDCVVCRLRGPLETIQRIARGLRRREEGVRRNLDSAYELEVLEIEAERASLIVDALLDLQPSGARPGSKLSNVARRPAVTGIADVHPSSQYGLTHREVDVLRLIIEGKTDRGIARSLSISTYTVNKHVANILGKMAAPSRTAAGVRAIREGIVV